MWCNILNDALCVDDWIAISVYSVKGLKSLYRAVHQRLLDAAVTLSLTLVGACRVTQSTRSNDNDILDYYYKPSSVGSPVTRSLLHGTTSSSSDVWNARRSVVRHAVIRDGRHRKYPTITASAESFEFERIDTCRVADFYRWRLLLSEYIFLCHPCDFGQTVLADSESMYLYRCIHFKYITCIAI